jgi:hypothetical protein
MFRPYLPRMSFVMGFGIAWLGFGYCWNKPTGYRCIQIPWRARLYRY